MGKHSARNTIPTAPATEAAPADVEHEPEAAPAAVVTIVEQEAAPADTADIEHQAEPTADEPTADEQEAAPADEPTADIEHGPTGDDDASREAIAFGRYADAFDAAVLAADLDAGWVPDGPTAHMKATLMSIGVTIGGRGAAAVTSRKLARLSAHDRVRGAAVAKPTSTSKPTSGTSGTSGTKAPGTPIAPALRLVIDAHGTTSPDGRRGVTVADAKRHAAADHGISAGGAIDNHAKPVRGPGITAAQAAAGIEPATIGGTRWFVLV